MLVHFARDAEGRPVRVDGGVHLGLAVDTRRKDGSRFLVVPVLRDAGAPRLRRLPRRVRAAGRGRPHRLADPRRAPGRQPHPDQPRRDRHHGLGAPADARSGLHHRRRRHRLPARVPGRERGAAGRARGGQGGDPHLHLRPPGDPGRRVRRVPGPRRGAAGRRRPLLRGRLREPGAGPAGRRRGAGAPARGGAPRRGRLRPRPRPAGRRPGGAPRWSRPTAPTATSGPTSTRWGRRRPATRR